MSTGGHVDRELLRSYVQAGHLNFLFGAGASAGYFPVLGGVEDALTEVARADAPTGAKKLARASLLAHFLESTLSKNRSALAGDTAAEGTLADYEEFARVINRVLLRRKSTLLEKRACIFTTNVDLMFEIGFDRAHLPINDGFSGRFARVLDTSNFGNLQFRTSTRYDQRSEVPTFDLMKLHGSVDWSLDDAGAQVSGDPSLASLAAVEAALTPIKAKLVAFASPSDVTAAVALSGGEEADGAVEQFLRAFDRLAVVLPEKAKFASTLLSQTYYELLRRFANELERENSLLLVHGFSFRDEHLRDLILRAGRTNPTLQVITFCFSREAETDIRDLLHEDQLPNRNFAFVAGDELDLCSLTNHWLRPLVEVGQPPQEQADEAGAGGSD